MEYPREPWKITPGRYLACGWVEVRNCDGQMLVTLPEWMAEHVIACVNAMANVPNPEAVGEVVEALKEAHRFMDYWCKHVGHEEWGEFVHGRSQRKQIEAALAKLEATE